MEMSEPVVMYLKTWVECALGESLLESCKVALKAGLIMCPLATLTIGLDVVWEQ